MSSIESCGPVTALTLGLPSTTAVTHPRGRLSKERFYTNTSVGKRLRQHFIEDIDSITMLAVIREQETGIPAGPLTNENQRDWPGAIHGASAAGGHGAHRPHP